MERYGRVDVLVNNAGGNRRGNFADLDDEASCRIFDIDSWKLGLTPGLIEGTGSSGDFLPPLVWIGSANLLSRLL